MDPVHQDENQWYFWDETWADRLGPYPTEALARNAMRRYCEHELGIKEKKE